MIFAIADKVIPLLRVENDAASDTMNDSCTEILLDSESDTDATWLCRTEVMVETFVERVELVVCTPKTTADSDVDADTTPLCLAEIALEMPSERVESVTCNTDTMVDNDVEMEVTPVCLADTVVEMPMKMDV